MSSYIHFTEEQKQRAAAVDLEEFLRCRGEKLLSSGREKRLASDHSVTVRGNEWYDHAEERGGHAVSFVQRFYGLSYPDAVTLLMGAHRGTGETICTAAHQQRYAQSVCVSHQASRHRKRCGGALCQGWASV